MQITTNIITRMVLLPFLTLLLFFQFGGTKAASADATLKNRNLFHSMLLLLLLPFFLLIAPIPVNAAYLWWTEDGSTFTTFGPNAAITINMGDMDYICDFVNPVTNIFIVPSGSVSMGGHLTDVSGTPNTVWGSSTGLFVSEPIGYTAPGGTIGPGTYAVIYDECENNRLDPEDFILDPAFEVVFPPTGVPPVDPAIQNIKDKAAIKEQEARHTANVMGSYLMLLEAIELFEALHNPLHNPYNLIFFAINESVAATLHVHPVAIAVKALVDNISHWEGIKADPPDPNFSQLTPLTPIEQIIVLSNDPLLIAATEGMGNAIQTEAALAKAFLSSLERYQGADAAGNGEWALIHARAVRDYANALVAQLGNSNIALAGFISELDADTRNFDEAAVTAEELRVRLATTGLTADEIMMTKNLGLTDAEIADRLNAYIAKDFSGLSKAEVKSSIESLIIANNNAIVGLQTDIPLLSNIVTTLEADPTVFQQSPIANAGGPYTVDEGDPLTLNGSGSIDPNGAITAWDWDLNGDGQFDDAIGVSPAVTINHEFVGLIGLRVTDNTGRTGIAYAQLTVTNVNNSPVIEAYSPPAGLFQELRLGNSLTFDITASDPDADPVSIQWYLDGVPVATGDTFPYSPANSAEIGLRIVRVVVSDGTALGGSVGMEWSVAVMAQDLDGDGWNANVDCNELDPTVNPGVTEVTGNGKDDDCNPVTPDVLQDADGDGYTNDVDCNDINPNINPGATEVCNGVDDDCDLSIDEGVLQRFYRDADSDTYGDTAVTTDACSAPAGYVNNNLDCNDVYADINPGVVEVCNGLDDNCNDQVDEGVKNTYYQDEDGDGYGDPAVAVQFCTAPAGYVINNTDCDDTRTAVNSGATEILYNGIDDDCNPATADGIDVDNDGYSDNVDCNDIDPTVNPGRKEVRHNGKDDDCNAATADDYAATFMVSSDDGGRVYYAHSNGDGTWSNYRQQADLSGTIRGAAIFDADNDGDLDFLIPVPATTLDLYLFVNDGNENFTNVGVAASSAAAGGGPYGMTAGDFNEDGNMDFLVSRDGANVIRGLGNGMGGFTVSEINTGFGNGREMDVADFDHDGHLDYIRATYSSGEIRLFRGNGDGTFTLAGVVADPGADPYGVTAGDFNNDGHPDIIANYGSNGDTYFYAGNGNGTFAAGIAAGSLDFNNYGTFDNYDFNRDGNQDIVSSSYSSRLLRFYPGNGDGTFGAAVQVNPALTYTNTLGVSAPPGPPPAGDPIAQIYPDVTEGVPGATIDFTGSYSSDNGSIVSYEWNFGDGSTASGATVTHAFPNAEGNYSVRLTVTDNDGRKNIAGALVRLKGALPVADAGGPYTFGESAATGGTYTVTLDGSGSTDDSGIAKYEWDFGSYLEDTFAGTTLDTLKWIAGTGVSQNESASIVGAVSWGSRYLFSLQDFLRESELTFTAKVLPENLSGNQYGMFGFKNTNATYNYNQMMHAIYFNNGSILIYEDASPRGTFGSYTRNVEYEIKIVLKATGARYYIRKAGDLLWSMLYDSNYSSTSAVKVGTDINIGTFKVDDVKVSLLLTGGAPVKKFKQGSYPVTLTVTDTTGQQDTDTTTINLVPGNPPVSNPGGPYAFGETFANQGKWTASLSGAGSTDDVAIESYSWNFGDGTTGTGATLSHQYSAAGTYTATLTVTDRAGQSNAASTLVTIEAGAFPVSSTGGPYEVPETQVVNRHWTVNFNGSGSSDDVAIWKYEWNFGDSGTAATASASHTYAYPGTYTVTLKITDHAGQAHTSTTTASVTGVGSPVADAGGPYFIEKGFPVVFNASNSADDMGILTYTWDFGDGTTGTGAKPAHTYSAEGTYTVSLTVKDIALQTNTDTAPVVVTTGNLPVANAGGPYTTNEDLMMRFDGSHSTDDYGIASYEWTIGSLVTHLSDAFDGTAIDSAKWLYPAAGVTQNNAITFTGGNGWGSRYLFSQDNFDAKDGLTLYAQVNHTSSGNMMVGFKDTGSSYSYTAMPYAFYFNAGTIGIYETGANRGNFGNYSLNTVYDVKVVLKSDSGVLTGARYYYKPASSSTWTLVYDSNYVPAYTAMKTGVSNHSGTFVLDNLSLTSGLSQLSGERPVTTFPDAGTYPVILKVTDGAGQSSTASTTLTVSADPSVITVPWQISGGIEIPHDTWSGEEVILKAVVKSRHEPLTYTWEFGDGATAAGTVTNKYDVSSKHIYTAASGTPFVAKLTVTDADGRTSSDTFPLIVREKSLEVEINKAIDDALWFVHSSQNRPAGWWQSSGWTTGYYSSPTASSIHAMEINGHLEVGDFRNDPYTEDVWRGMNYLLTTIRQTAINDQAYGNPDINGNGIGIEVNSGSPIYEGGQVMMALVASGTPDLKAVSGGSGVINRTYREIVEDMAEMYYWGQGDAESGYAAGGWRYGWQAQADNSACQWAALGMDAAEEQSWINVPEWVKDRNEVWLAYSIGSGGTGYGYSGSGNGVATSPSGLAQVAFDNIPTTDNRWKKTENYLAQNWNTWYNGTGNYYALYALAKAMRIARPTEVTILGEGTQYAIDWYNDPARGVARTIVNQQDANGQFTGGAGTKYVEGSFRTAWGVIILSKTLFVLPPVADAGEDRVWGVDWSLTLDGSRSFHLDPFRSIVLYEWDFDGDGTYDYSSTEPTATHTFTALGTYTITLRVTDNNDPAKYDTDTMKVIVAIPPHPPVAVPGGPYTGTAGIAVQLDGSASYDIDPTDMITLYGWELDGVFPYDFDDAFGPKPAFAFNTPGNFNIGLRVMDNGVLNDLNGNGQVDENEKLEDIRWNTVNITANHAPTADAGGPYVVDEGALITLDGKDSSDPDGNTITFGWDLDNDGQYDDSPEIKPLINWPDNGSFTIGLQISDSALTGTDTAQVTVLNVAPAADAGPDQTIDEGQTVLLGGGFTDPGSADTHTVEWDFGDGSPVVSGTLMPSHLYADNGVYTVTLTVTDDDGGVGSDTLTVTVNNAAPVVNAGQDQAINKGDSVNLAPATFTDAGIYDTHMATIDWGDGTVESGAISEASGNGSVSGSHIYASAGTYTVQVTVTDNAGASGSDSLQVVVAETDGCIDDPNKTAPGICGCGIADTDSDNDGIADCNDQCSADPNKVAPGICGCGIADTDSDNDRTADCNDQCAADPNKTLPGICGCGIADTDADGDGIADCIAKPVTDLTARPKSRKIDIVWTHVGVNSYNVYRSSAGGPYQFIANTTSTYSVYADFGLTNGVRYCYKVRSVNALGTESADSNEACATPAARTR
ncbi:MAG: PKD domain-containing protein [Nitrospirae bacterium]|nr:PKD domain-containing protein [Nitrospirota bacterium]